MGDWRVSQLSKGLDSLPVYRRANAAPTPNLKLPVNLNPCMSLDCERKPEDPERTHASMGRTCKLHKAGGFKPRTLWL